MIRTYFVDGDKGGVGKSTVARAVVDMLIQAEYFSMPAVSNLFIVDADPANADVCGDIGYKDETVGETNIAAIRHPIRYVDDWYSLFNKLEKLNILDCDGNTRMVFSLPAAAGLVLAENPEVLQMMEIFNGFPVWVLGNERSSVEQLGKRIDAAPLRYSRGFVVRNLKHGFADSFAYWNTSAVRKEALEWGWQEIDFPVFATSIAVEIGSVPMHVVERDKINASGTRAMLGTQMAVRNFRSACGQRLRVLETSFNEGEA